MSSKNRAEAFPGKFRVLRKEAPAIDDVTSAFSCLSQYSGMTVHCDKRGWYHNLYVRWQET
jgi:hypothetical protein